MKLHIITIGQPKLDYAKLGWQEYYQRLKHYHDLRVSHIPDKRNNADYILQTAGSSYKIALEITGTQLTSPKLAQFLEKRALDGREVALIIGGPDGLPNQITHSRGFSVELWQSDSPARFSHGGITRGTVSCQHH